MIFKLSFIRAVLMYECICSNPTTESDLHMSQFYILILFDSLIIFPELRLLWKH